MNQRRNRSSFPSGVSSAPGLLGSLCRDCPDYAKCAFTAAVVKAAGHPSPKVVMLKLRHACHLFHEGMPLTGLYVVCEGMVIQYGAKKPARFLCVHGKGTCPDLIDNLLGSPIHRTSALAVGEAVVAFIPQEEVDAGSEPLSSNATNLLRQTARQAGILEDRFLHGQTAQSYDRVVDLFRQLLEASGQATAAEATLALVMDRPLFAKLTGVTPATFSRIMTRLKNSGLVIPSEQGLRFPQPDQLCRAVEG